MIVMLLSFSFFPLVMPGYCTSRLLIIHIRNVHWCLNSNLNKIEVWLAHALSGDSDWAILFNRLSDYLFLHILFVWRYVYFILKMDITAKSTLPHREAGKQEQNEWTNENMRLNVEMNYFELMITMIFTYFNIS